MQADLFSDKLVPKMLKPYILCSEDGLGSPKRFKKQRIFSLIKSAPAKRKKGFYTSRALKNWGIIIIFVVSSLNR
jgi:hypothetical protein